MEPGFCWVVCADWRRLTTSVTCTRTRLRRCLLAGTDVSCRRRCGVAVCGYAREDSGRQSQVVLQAEGGWLAGCGPRLTCRARVAVTGSDPRDPHNVSSEDDGEELVGSESELEQWRAGECGPCCEGAVRAGVHGEQQCTAVQ